MVEAYKPLYTVKQAAQILMNTGQLPYLNLGQKKIRGSDLERFIEKYPTALPRDDGKGGRVNAEKNVCRS